MYTEKQVEYLKNANKRWNIKVGAARSGKTYVDFFNILLRVQQADDGGIIVLLGNTVGTLCRNIIDPMRAMWGEAAVSGVSDEGSVLICGRKCSLIGAGRADQTAKLQGASVAYAYGDEITTWAREVFEMLKSRLDRPGSRFDGTANPASPNHWLKAFIESGADVYVQEYTIDDNPCLPPEFVINLKREYEGTAYYDRYILGRWTAAEGIIYRRFALDPDSFVREAPPGLEIVAGVDFGGTKSATAFAACAQDVNSGTVYVLSSRLVRSELDSASLCGSFGLFCRGLEGRGELRTVYCDSAEPILIRSLRRYCAENGIRATVAPARKSPVLNRISTVNSLFSCGRLFLSADCATLKNALLSAVWKEGTQDVRLDDGSTDIDSLDAFEYCVERMRV